MVKCFYSNFLKAVFVPILIIAESINCKTANTVKHNILQMHNISINAEAESQKVKQLKKEDIVLPKNRRE